MLNCVANIEMSINEKLQAAIKELQIMRLTERHLQNIEKSIREKTDQVFLLEDIVDTEYQDIEALEATSINNLFANILGDKNQQLEIEKQEYLDVVLAYKDAKQSLNLLEQERKKAIESIKEIRAKETLVEELMKIREREIEKSDIKYKSKYLQLCRQADQSARMRLEIIEAQIEGLKCKRETEKIVKFLEQAEKLREWGFENKKDYRTEKTNVDLAVEAYYKLKIHLQKFEKELDDIYTNKKMVLSSDFRKFDHFIEVYYNYLINDWIVKSKISNTTSMMLGLKDEILRLLNSLEHKEKVTKELVEKAEEGKKEILQTKQ